MHYYKRNIGDYAKDTMHLSTLQHGIYSRLMDYYYANEEPIPAGKAARIAVAPKDEVETVLCDFFELSEDGSVWRHKRIDAEIGAYHDKAEKNRENGRAGGRPRKDGNPDGSQKKATGNLNHKPLTKNQEKNPPNPPEGGKSSRRKKSEETTITQFIESLAGEKAFLPTDPLFTYTSEIGLDHDLVKLAWLEFRDLMVLSAKKQRDWRATFRIYVRRGYLKLWWRNEAENEWQLTTAGKQAWAKHKGEL
jgi:uncharacterized protein YdaU (DUF1376 family)